MWVWRFLRRFDFHGRIGARADGIGTTGHYRVLALSQSEDRTVLVGCRGGETYSGKLVENITQSTARDLLAEAMWRMEKAGLAIVGHVHDEVILEVPTGSVTVEDVTRIMNENPSWAEGLPLSSAGYFGPDFYFKD